MSGYWDILKPKLDIAIHWKQYLQQCVLVYWNKLKTALDIFQIGMLEYIGESYLSLATFDPPSHLITNASVLLSEPIVVKP